MSPEVLTNVSAGAEVGFTVTLAGAFTVPATASCRRGDVRVKIGPGAVLELIPCDSHQGRIVLGTLVSEALPPSHVQAITEVLIQTALPA
jgi:hypothetical protein